MRKMRVSESFYSVQGEGHSQGVPAFFIRLQGCNLDCGYCDTTKVWKRGKDISNDELTERIEEAGQQDNVLTGRTHLIWTGGEPAMPGHQRAIIGFNTYITKRFGVHSMYQELETNGTMPMGNDFLHTMRQINCSPKLTRSGEPVFKRIVPEAIGQFKRHPNTWYKFVVRDIGDVTEMEETFVKPLRLPKERVILMPEVDNLGDLSETTRNCYELTKQTGYRTVSRGQILAWDRVTGV